MPLRERAWTAGQRDSLPCHACCAKDQRCRDCRGGAKAGGTARARRVFDERRGARGRRARAVARVPPTANPIETLAAQARAYRSFAKAHPNAYALIHDANAERTEAGQQARLAALSPTLPAFTALAGESGALNAARTLVPFLHGFVSMELAGAFRLGGGLDEAFENGVATILAGLSSNHNPRRRE